MSQIFNHKIHSNFSIKKRKKKKKKKERKKKSMHSYIPKAKTVHVK